MKSLDCLHYLVGMFVRLNLMPDFAHNAIFIDQERLTVDAHILLSVQFLLSIDTIKLGNACICIGEQGKVSFSLRRIRYRGDRPVVASEVAASIFQRPVLTPVENFHAIRPDNSRRREAPISPAARSVRRRPGATNPETLFDVTPRLNVEDIKVAAIVNYRRVSRHLRHPIFVPPTSL